MLMLSDVLIYPKNQQQPHCYSSPMNMVNTPVVFASFIMPDWPTVVKLLFQKIIIIKLL